MRKRNTQEATAAGRLRELGLGQPDYPTRLRDGAPAPDSWDLDAVARARVLSTLPRWQGLRNHQARANMSIWQSRC